MIMQAAFFKLAKIIPLDEAVKHMKKAIVDSYGSKGEKVVDMNHQAVDKGLEAVIKVGVPESWANEVDEAAAEVDAPDFVKNVANVMNRQEGDKLPVSAFVGREDGTFPVGTTKYEKRGVAIDVPEWQPDVYTV